MKKILDSVKQAVGSRLEHADVRVVETEKQDLQLRNGVLAGNLDSRSCGYGIRVLVDGFWGFSSNHDFSAGAIEATAREALALAEAAKRASGSASKVKWQPVAARCGNWTSPCVKDPFAVSLREKLDLLQSWDERLRRVRGVTIATGSLSFRKDTKVYSDTEGSEIEQHIVQSGMGYSALATNDHEAQIRSYPNSFGGQFAQSGLELVDTFDFSGEAERVAGEAVQLLSAPQCPPGVYDIILDSSQLGLQIHESCGHPIELDRVLGWEANYAGRSFLTLDQKGLQYGSPGVTIVADSTSPGGLGTYAFDDEGIPADRWLIVDKGRFVGYLTSRETAPVVNESNSHATVRADGWNRVPMIRMVNVSLEPGTWKLDDLFADTEGGIYFETNKSWSIDQLRYNFQFGTEAAWEIRGGKKGTLFKNATYHGITPDFWNRCDAIGNRNHWVLWGLPNCGKGEPGQLMSTGHGASPARFRKVQVGI